MRYLIPLLALLVSSSAVAAPVYKWVDEAGVTHYSSKPQEPGQKPADLPPIMRAQMKIQAPRVVSCDQHGGVDCQSGPDKDGSVVCYDGFRGASLPFAFHCKTARLELADVSDVREDGTFTVFLRNRKSVEAKGVAVLYKPFTGPDIRLDGPEVIDAYGAAEYRLALNKAKDVIMAEKPSLADITIQCANCPN